MKHIAYHIAAIALFLLSGCSSFLERTSQNQIVPTTVEQYKEMLQGRNGYFYNAPQKYAFVNIATDDVAYTDVSALAGVPAGDALNVAPYRFVYQWSDEIENETFTDGAFDYFYSQVLVANTVFDAIDRLDDPTGERELVRGQALFHRAFAYFVLATLYAPAYNESQASTPCVPLKLSPTPSTQNYPKSTMGEVWGQIRSDIDAGISAMKDIDVFNPYEIDVDALLVLAVRVALQMEDFDAVIDYGKQLFEHNESLFDITQKERSSSPESTAPGGADIANFISSENPEIVWCYGSYSGNFPSLLGGLGESDVCYYALSDELIGCFADGLKEGERDRRLDYWFTKPGQFPSPINYVYNYSILKYDRDDGYPRTQALRVGEVYISMAEAYARKTQPDYDEALRLLNALRSRRILHYSDRTLDEAGGTAGIVEYIWQERRRELCCEELHRWWDLRRQGQPRLEHRWRDGEKYVLEQGDAAYTFNYPTAEREVNPSNFNSRPHREPVQ